MLARLRPPVGFVDVLSALSSRSPGRPTNDLPPSDGSLGAYSEPRTQLTGGVAAPEPRFELEFAARYGFPHGIFFPYGRSALHTLLSALGWRDRQVLCPAYTCVVVPHAVTLSGNRPVFVDSEPDHFLVSAHELAQVASKDISMAVLTPLFGYPINLTKSIAAVRSASRGAFVLVDAAQGFHVGEDAAGEVDGVLFSFGIGKILSTLSGGMLLLRDAEIHRAVRAHRDLHFAEPGTLRPLAQAAYGLAVNAAFREPFLSPVDFLENRTRLLYRFTEYFYGKHGVSLPDDALVRATAFQSRLGLRQLPRLARIIARRREISLAYERRLLAEGIRVFDHDQTPTFSHFPLAVADRGSVLRAMQRRSVQLGVLIDYASTDLAHYGAGGGDFANARKWGASMINLPNWPGMTSRDCERVLVALLRTRDTLPAAFY